jgi:drug/metabolite transporter (DMT)-like permease
MASSNKSRAKGILFIIIASLLLGSYGVWSRLIGDSFDAFSQAWIRALIISLMLSPVVIYGKHIKPLAKRDWKWFIMFFMSPLFSQAPTFYAFNHMDIGTATLLLFVSLLITMYCVGFFVLKEKVTLTKCLSLIIAMLGLFLIFSFSLEKFTLFSGLMACLVGVVSGLQVSFSKKLSGNYSPLYLSFIGWLMVIPANIFGSLLLGSAKIPPFYNSAWIFLFCFALAGLVSAWLYLVGLKYIEASIGGLVGLIEIIFGIAFGMLLFGEVLTGRIIIGAVLILLAASLPNIQDFISERQ